MTSAAEVLSLETARAELRLPPGETGHDTLLETQIAQAVAWVSAEISAPILDRVETVRAAPPAAADRPVSVPASAVRRVTAVAGWSPAAALRAAPDLAITGWGRVEPSPASPRDAVWLWPPAGGWPATAAGSCFEVTVVRGQAEIDPSIRAAVVLALRQLYDGAAEIRPTAAVYALLAPHRRLG